MFDRDKNERLLFWPPIRQLRWALWHEEEKKQANDQTKGLPIRKRQRFG